MIYVYIASGPRTLLALKRSPHPSPREATREKHHHFELGSFSSVKESLPDFHHVMYQTIVLKCTIKYRSKRQEHVVVQGSQEADGKTHTLNSNAMQGVPHALREDIFLSFEKLSFRRWLALTVPRA